LQAERRFGGGGESPDGGHGLDRVPGLLAVAGLHRVQEPAGRIGVSRDALAWHAPAVRGQEPGTEGAGLHDGDVDAQGSQFGVFAERARDAFTVKH
jgi:hypothetical protein